MFGELKFNFVPLSFKEMKGSGYLFPNESKEFKNFRKFVKYQDIDKTKLEANFKGYSSKDQDYKEPTVHIFQAGDGDSSLFCFGSNCILIDGGRSSTPCFWDKLKEFKQVDCVILTHGDADHWEGLLPFLYAQKKIPDNVTKISKFVMNWSDEQSDEKLAQKILKRNYYHVYHIGDYVNKNLIDLKNFVFKKNVKQKQTEKIGEIKLTYILPSHGYSKLYQDLVSLSDEKNIFYKLKLSDGTFEKYAKKKYGWELKENFPTNAKKKYEEVLKEKPIDQAYGSLTNINIFGISFVIECKNKLFLFTAYCHSQDIVEGLKECFENRKKFWYVDAPHHGSKDNKFKTLLDYCEEIENLVVSSNHKLRPSEDFLGVLEKDQRSKTPKIKKIYFNYETSQSKNFLIYWKSQRISFKINQKSFLMLNKFSFSNLKIFFKFYKFILLLKCLKIKLIDVKSLE